MAKTILIVDDEPVVVEISKRKLQERGYDVLVANDGIQAFEVLAKQIPDMILLDIQMPNMNGYTFMMEKIKNPQFSEIPVVVLTSYAEMEPLFKRHGARAYLLKPLKLQEVLDKVKEIVGSAS